jgi:hypothetical protein
VSVAVVMVRLALPSWAVCLCLLWGFTTIANAAPLQKRDADFASVRYKLARERSGRGGDPKQKYFRECLECSNPCSLV